MGTSDDDAERREYLAALGARIAQARAAAGLTKSALARALSCDVSSVFKWEHGKMGIGVEAVRAIAERTGVSCDWLITGRGDAPAAPSADAHEPDAA